MRLATLIAAGLVALVVLVIGVLNLHKPLSGAPQETSRQARQRHEGPSDESAASYAQGAKPGSARLPALPGRPGSGEPATARRDGSAALGEIASVVRLAISILRGLLIAGALLVICLAASRSRSRHRRRMQRVLLHPGRASEAAQIQGASLAEAIIAVMRERWWVRLWRGTPPAVTLEAVGGVHPGGVCEQQIAMAIPEGKTYLRALRGALAARYPDMTVEPVPGSAPEAIRSGVKHVIRLKKARFFEAPIDRPRERGLEGQEPYPDGALGNLLSAIASTEERVLVQIVVSPVPHFFQRLARWLAHREPGGGREEQERAPGAVRSREDRARSETTAFRSLCFCEIRVGAETYAAARQVAGELAAGAEGGENHLRQRHMLLRRRLYVERMARAESNPLPSWMRGVYSSLEIAALWQVPTAAAKGIAIERNNVPQLAVPPEVYRPPDIQHAIATDLRGSLVGIRPEDFKYGTQASGAAGAGKTSILAKIAEVRALEPNTVVIVLDPKGDLAEAAACSMPLSRTVRYLDVANPLFGIALRTANRDLEAEAAIFSEAMVDVSRTEEGESQALNASQRSFKFARLATLALEEDPTLWHTLRWLAADDEAEAWRAKKIQQLQGDPRYEGVWDHYARHMPTQMRKSPTQATMRLEAPYNKVQVLLADARLNTVLHHPVTVSFDEVIARREILIISARVPDHPGGEILLKFFVQLLHRAILAQQKLPESERARVAVIADDAGAIFSPTIAAMMENDRSAGLDLALGWQHGGQMTPELAQAIDGLCNSRFHLRSSEEDALRIVHRLNPAYDQRLSAGLVDLGRQRVEVNQLTSLDLKHAVAVLQAGEALSSSFTVKTIPWRRDPAKLAEFERRMREEGGYDPQVIAPPAELRGSGETEVVDEDLGGGGEAPAPPAREDQAPASPPAQAAGPQPREKSAAVRRGRREAQVAELGSPTDKEPGEGYAEIELMREKAGVLSWEPAVSEPSEVRHNALNGQQRALIEALYELRLLSGGQIQREFLISTGERQVRRELSRLIRMGMIQRGEISLARAGGRGKRIYVLAEQGFALLRDATDHPASGKWRAPELRSAQHAVHDLARNEWLFAFRSLAPRQLIDWRGPRSGKLEVPLVKEPRAAARRMEPLDLGDRSPIGFAGEEFSSLIPDLSMELELEKPGGERVRTDLLVEIEWGNNDETVRRKALAYDALLTGWWQEHARYREDLGRPPVVFFVVPDVARARRFIEILDKTLLSHLLAPAQTQSRDERERGITPSAKKLYLGRRNTFVAVARDVHQRTLRAWRVPAETPEERVRAARNARERREAERPRPRPFLLIDPRDLVDPAT